MPDAAQFTMNLFDTTALGWTVATPEHQPSAETEKDDDAPEAPAALSPQERGVNFVLTGDRQLARGWPARARDNIAAITLSKELEDEGRAPTADEQEQLLRFIGFGATELAQNAFPLPGETEFREGWKEIGQTLAEATTAPEYAALARSTQYAHYTPEPVIRAIWRAAQHLGFAAGRVLEPGMGTGLFFSMIPDALRDTTRLTGIEYDPITARIAALIHPQARVRREDYTRSALGGGFDLAIGNPPFADRVIRADPSTAKLGLRLHDYFIARSIDRLRPGGLAIFVTSTGTMDKAGTTAREHIASMADLIGAVRLPESSMRATAGTEVVIDILVFQRRAEGQAPGGQAWMALQEIELVDTPVEAEQEPDLDGLDDAEIEAITDSPDAKATPRHLLQGVVQVNEYFIAHPEMVLGSHGQRRGIYGPGWSYTCRSNTDAGSLETQLDRAFARLPANIFTAIPDSLATEDEQEFASPVRVGRAADGATIKEGSYHVGQGGRLCQITGGESVPIKIKAGKTGDGISLKAAKIIRGLMPIRDAVRDVLRAQTAGQPWKELQVRLRCCYSNFIRYYGPINHTVVSILKDDDTGEEREQHRRPNLGHFADDPDCWLVASIEDYDIDTGSARMGPIFHQRVVSPPAMPMITSASDALAVTLNELGFVDPERLGELLECSPEEALARLGDSIFRDPAGETWETADAYLSGQVRHKLAAAEAAAAIDRQYVRNVEALRTVQPRDIPPSDITARLGAPWLPTDIIQDFVRGVMGGEVEIFHTVQVAAWGVKASCFSGTAAGTSEWGTSRRHAGQLLHDALNSATPQIYDVEIVDGEERRVLNPEATEAAKEKLLKIKTAFTEWVWIDPERADQLSRLYNDKFNNLVPRHFDGRHLTLPGASDIITLYQHQKRVIWRIITSGSTYVAHAVGSGKTFSIAAAIMEERRLGLVGKAMLVVPGHCLAQASREFLQLYPTARILVADETNFAKEKRARFLARAATSCWDAIIITHSAFRFIAVPTEFEREMIEAQIGSFESLIACANGDDRITRKRLEATKERLAEKLETLRDRRDDMLTIAELGIDQVIIDEAQEFRKLTFATNRTALKGVDPDGSQRAWDLYVKRRFIETINPRRAIIQASGTPITNTMGEMFTLIRYQDEGLLRERGVHEFDAWASTFGDTHTELELQPSGAYKPVERFSKFINVPELIDIFRTVADVVVKDDLRGYLKLPSVKGGHRLLITAEASEDFREYQAELADRIREIESRTRKVQKGDDILLKVITDGRHAAIDMRLARPWSEDDPDNKLNKLVRNAHRIWRETATQQYQQRDGTPFPIPGAAQMIFSDLGTLAAEDTRSFSAYRWIKEELIRLGVPAAEIAIMQHFKRSAEKQRLFGDINAGRVRFVLGSTQTMGTGVNAQLRLKSLHHLDVPWLPSDIEQREGRIERQGNQHDEVEIYAYATLGSMDATMWQNNERKARFISAALSGDRTIRTIDDIGDTANQFALAKAIASGDARLMQKAGLEGEIARLERQRAAHFDDQLDVRRRIMSTSADLDAATRRIGHIKQDLESRIPTRGEGFYMQCGERRIDDRRIAGSFMLSKVRMLARGRSAQEIDLGEIGGFRFTCIAGPTWRETFEASLVMRRSNFDHHVEMSDDLTPGGLIARIEHLLERMPLDLQEQERKAEEAARRLTGYKDRVGQPFALQGELDGKLAQLAALESDLAQTAARPLAKAA
jgi:N12 class adenine-specific DNA methylase/adenine-specific DNA methylase